MEPRPLQLPQAMTDAQFRQWAALLEQRTGMVLPLERKSFLVTSLGLRMRQVGYSNFQTYFDYLQWQDVEQQEWQVLVDRLTVHETQFFRHPQSLDLIQTHWLMPYLNTAPADLRLNIFSVGCSTGEEAYTLAMVIDHSITLSAAAMDWQIQAVDISRPCLATARAGQYPPRHLNKITPYFQSRYGSMQDNQRWQISESLRQKIQFTEMNLLHIGQQQVGFQHLIVCQNVLIYFDRQRSLAILEGLVKWLLPGGLLVLAPGEMVGWRHPSLKTVYYKDAVAFCRLNNDDTKGSNNYE